VVTTDFLSIQDDWTISQPNFFDKEEFNNAAALLELNTRARGFEQLNNSQCMDWAVNPLNATAELVLVTNETYHSNNESTLIHGFISGNNAPRWEASTGWVCSAYNKPGWPRYCSPQWAHSFQDRWLVKLGPMAQRPPVHELLLVEHCLAGQRVDMKSRCEINYNADILILVCVLTAVDAMIIICCMVMMQKQSTLMQLGDAIAEALERNTAALENSMPSTSVKCEAFKVQDWPRKGDSRPRWSSAVSLKTWIVSGCL
jgi:hypothetical protein